MRFSLLVNIMSVVGLIRLCRVFMMNVCDFFHFILNMFILSSQIIQKCINITERPHEIIGKQFNCDKSMFCCSCFVIFHSYQIQINFERFDGKNMIFKLSIPIIFDQSDQDIYIDFGSLTQIFSLISLKLYIRQHISKKFAGESSLISIFSLFSFIKFFYQLFQHSPVYNNNSMKQTTCLIMIISIVASIRFNYNLPKYQIQCFHESVQKNSRFQISVKGQSSTYYLHVVDKKPLHEDTRTTNAQYKYFSAFAQQSEVLTFCIGNLGNTSIFFDIQFYHGIYLQDSFEENVQGRELQDLSDRWRQMLNMVQSNYDIYRNKILDRKVTGERITFVLTLMVAIIVLGTVIIKVVYYRKIVGYLKDKKIV